MSNACKICGTTDYNDKNWENYLNSGACSNCVDKITKLGMNEVYGSKGIHIVNPEVHGILKPKRSYPRVDILLVLIILLEVLIFVMILQK